MSAYQQVPSVEDGEVTSPVPLTDIDTSPSPPRNRIAKVVGLVTLAAGAAVVASSSHAQTAVVAAFHKVGTDWYYDDDDKYGPTAPFASEAYSCCE